MLEMSSLVSAQIHRNRHISGSINRDEHGEDDDLLNLQEDSESTSSFGRTTMFYNQRQHLRTSLKNFFMNPFEKFYARGRIPWKLIFHILKLIVLTVMLVLFGQDKFQLRVVFNAYKINLGTLLIKDFATDFDDVITRKTPVIQQKYEIEDAISSSLVNYYKLGNSPVGVFGFNYDQNNKTLVPLLCIQRFSTAKIDVSQWRYDINEEQITECFSVDCFGVSVDECRNAVTKVLPKTYNGFVEMNLTFEVRSIFLSLKAAPKCVQLYAIYTLRNVAMSGGISSEFGLKYDEIDCNSTSKIQTLDSLIGIRQEIGQIVIDAAAILLSVITGGLIIKRMVKTAILYKQTYHFYMFHFNRRLTWGETTCFLNGWDIASIFADVLTLLGVIYKVLIDTEINAHLDLTAVFIGTSVAINWFLALRFLSFDKGYYILVLTINVAMPNIMRLVVCVAAIYVGYVFCGWVVFGPYVAKFNSISQTTESLFALINGDEILDTFMQVDDRNKLLWMFSRFYFYTFIMLFTYVVLSVTISLISDAMMVAQSAAQTGIGPWMIGADIFPELELGWSKPHPTNPTIQNEPTEAPAIVTSTVRPARIVSNQNLNSASNKL